MKSCISVLILSLMLSACAVNTGHQFLDEMSNQDISSKLVKGKTTKENVRCMFGDPSDIDILPDNKENWAYSYTRSEAKGVNFIPFANWVYRGTNDNTRKLKILFNPQGIVEHFAFTSSSGETQMGLFQ